MGRRAALLTAVAVGACTIGLSGVAPDAAAATQHRPVALRAVLSPSVATDPAVNVPPSPDYWPTCLQSGASSSACINAVVGAIDNARALEGVGPLTLPDGFATLSPAVQTFVVSNLERVDRGLTPAAGMVDSLNTLSQTAAVADADPVLPSWTVGPFSANRWGSIWAGDLNALASDYDWMYNDGWGPNGSYNLDCTTATSSGCWGHRHNLLSSYGDEELVTGVGSVQQTSWLSIAQIFVAGTGSYPAFTRAWSEFAPATSGGSASTAQPNAVPLVADATSMRISAPAALTYGRAGLLTGRLLDTTTGSGVAGVAVDVCAKAAGSTTASCTTLTTDPTGAVTSTVRPKLNTSYWLRYSGDQTHAAATSTTRVVQVRPTIRLRWSRSGARWLVTAALAPVHGQAVRLQRYSSGSWRTVRHTTASATLRFSRLTAGTYRLVVRATSLTAAAKARIRLR